MTDRLREAATALLREAKAVADDHHSPRYTRLDDAIESLRAALAAPPITPPAAEPLAWECKAGGLKPLSQRLYESQPDNIKRHYTRITPPAASPEPAVLIQGLTWVLVSEGINKHKAREIAAAYMREAMNCAAASDTTAKDWPAQEGR